ncbi:unnamed protein product [Orchesella dallaii]|uniref:Uncharacterized protein n=1 Tax=Orchesella dallaii TaxID=48710 RepID=A0ABP1Q418_9HEXA
MSVAMTKLKPFIISTLTEEKNSTQDGVNRKSWKKQGPLPHFLVPTQRTAEKQFNLIILLALSLHIRKHRSFSRRRQTNSGKKVWTAFYPRNNDQGGHYQLNTAKDCNKLN